MNGAALRTISIDVILKDKELMKMQVDLQKRLPSCHVGPQCLAALLCGSALRKNKMSQRPFRVLDEGGMTLVDW